MEKALIVSTFHRYVLTGEFKDVPKHGGGTECVEIERKEMYPAGKTVTEGVDGVTAADIADWTAKGLAKAAE